MTREADRDDAALREAFAELHRGEAAGAPVFAQLIARPRPATTRSARALSRSVRQGDARHQRRLSMSRIVVRRLVPRLAAAAAVVVAAATGVWLARSEGEPGAARFTRDVEPLATWVAPTDFLLDTPAVELLRTTPEIPGPLPSSLAAADARLPTGETP